MISPPVRVRSPCALLFCVGPYGWDPILFLWRQAGQRPYVAFWAPLVDRGSPRASVCVCAYMYMLVGVRFGALGLWSASRRSLWFESVVRGVVSVYI